MTRWRGDDVQQIDTFGGQHFSGIGVVTGKAVAGGAGGSARCVAVGDRDQAHRQALPGGVVKLAEVTATDGGDAQF